MWLVTQMAIVRGVELGVSLVMVIAYLVINASTHNAILSIGATATIGGIVTSTMGAGVQVMAQWFSPSQLHSHPFR